MKSEGGGDGSKKGLFMYMNFVNFVTGSHSSLSYADGVGSNAGLWSVSCAIQIEPSIVIFAHLYCVRSLNRTNNRITLLAGKCDESGQTLGSLSETRFEYIEDCDILNATHLLVLDEQGDLVLVDLTNNLTTKVQHSIPSPPHHFTVSKVDESIYLFCKDGGLYQWSSIESRNYIQIAGESTSIIEKDGHLLTSQYQKCDGDLELISNGTLLLVCLTSQRLRVADMVHSKSSTICQSVSTRKLYVQRAGTQCGKEELISVYMSVVGGYLLTGMNTGSIQLTQVVVDLDGELSNTHSLLIVNFIVFKTLTMTTEVVEILVKLVCLF